MIEEGLRWFFLIAVSCLFGMSASVEEFDSLIETVEENNPEETKRIEEMFGDTPCPSS
ncbi:hypothetical protein P4678_21075 [Priestia megaterium]|uniref:hypothetical protein n=1 Tax=Priestia megaterium TaxID=1404 RepID=UPI002E1B6C91|nr:hypothetical protein [Priestia megaterium]MED4297150.1 hypothetical protein [Priestia megaterium]